VVATFSFAAEEGYPKAVAFASLLGRHLQEMLGLVMLSSHLESAATTRAAQFQFTQAVLPAAAWTQEVYALLLGHRLAVSAAMLMLLLVQAEIQPAGHLRFAVGMESPRMWLGATLSLRPGHPKLKVGISRCNRGSESWVATSTFPAATAGTGAGLLHCTRAAAGPTAQVGPSTCSPVVLPCNSRERFVSEREMPRRANLAK
jgi:hypothetical protein